MPVKRAPVIVEPKVAAFMARREAIVIEVVEATPEPVQASIIAEPTIETPAIVEASPVVPEPVIEQVEEKHYPYGKKKGQSLKGVGLNFPVETIDKLELLAQLIQEKDGVRLDKSAYVAGVLVGVYPNLDELFKEMQTR